MATPALVPVTEPARLPTRSRLLGWRRPTVLGGVYVTAWVVGLLVAPGAPGIDAAASTVHRHYQTHTAAAVAQSLLVHGVAGIALLFLAIEVRRLLRARTHARALADTAGVAGAAAAAISLLQVVFMGVLAAQVASTPAERTLALVDAINTADAVKLLALGTFVGAASLLGHRTSSLPRWLWWLGAVLASLLPVSGATFVLDQPSLYAALYLSLPLLLVWVGGLGLAIDRATAART